MGLKVRGILTEDIEDRMLLGESLWDLLGERGITMKNVYDQFDPLDKPIFARVNSRKVIQIFKETPGESFSCRELAKHFVVPSPTIAGILRKLSNQGIINCSKEPGGYLYSLVTKKDK